MHPADSQLAKVNMYIRSKPNSPTGAYFLVIGKLDIQLKTKPDEFVERFFSLRRPQDVASLLEIPYKVMNYHLYVTPPSRQYELFSIPKKTGGTRELLAPITTIKILQRKLNQILQAVYTETYQKRHFAVHGFVYGRSIQTNARKHTGKRYVLNIDLLDFFPSINFGRVYGMFQGRPHNLPAKVAAVLARICVYRDSDRDQLPQGAPTSPIVSNMICAPMDSDLYRLGKEYHCKYTRYADDITFSTNNAEFPEELAIVTPLEVKGKYEAEVGPELHDIIESNSFSVNQRKVRIQHRNYRQTVTGLTVNEFPNVRREYTNQLRAMLHSWETEGLNRAEKKFLERYDRKERWEFEQGSLFKNAVKGKLNFLRMVRGRHNTTYERFCEKLASLDQSFFFIKNIRTTSPESLQRAVFVLESQRGQGTAFSLDTIGIVTCAHNVVGDKLDTFLNRADAPSDRQRVVVRYADSTSDFALIEVKPGWAKAGLLRGDSTKMEMGDTAKVVGFPNYAEGKSIHIHEGKVTGRGRWRNVGTINIDARIIYGNSGGPVLNGRNEVIGIAFYGAQTQEEADQRESGVIPIETLDHLKQG